MNGTLFKSRLTDTGNSVTDHINVLSLLSPICYVHQDSSSPSALVSLIICQLQVKASIPLSNILPDSLPGIRECQEQAREPACPFFAVSGYSGNWASDINSVQLPHMTFDISSRHSFGIYGNNILLHVLSYRILVFLDYLWCIAAFCGVSFFLAIIKTSKLSKFILHQFGSLHNL